MAGRHAARGNRSRAGLIGTSLILAIGVSVPVFAAVSGGSNAPESCRFNTPEEWSAEMAREAEQGSGWLASDGYVTTALPDGRFLFLMGDTFVGRIRTERVLEGARMQRNAAVVYDPDAYRSTGCFTTTASSESGILSDSGGLDPAADPSATWYWPMKSLPVAHGSVSVWTFAAQMSGSRKEFDFTNTGVSLFELSVDSGGQVVRRSHRELQLPTIGQVNWGWGVEEDDGWVYVYGSHWRTGESFTRDLYLMRIPRESAITNPADTSTWQALTLWGWAPAEGAGFESLMRVAEGVGATGSVNRNSRGWQIVTRPAEIMDSHYAVLAAAQPDGPFEVFSKQPDKPANPGQWLYNAQAHPELPAPNGLQWVSVDSNVTGWTPAGPLDSYRAKWHLIPR